MKKLVMALLVLAAAASLKADTDGYVMLSVFSPGQIPIAQTSLDGARLNLIYGECQNLNGFDCGLVGRVRENMNGFQLGLASLVGTDVAGAQIGLANIVESDFAGFQLGVWNEVSGNSAGFQLGLVNTTGTLDGLQIGLLNFIAEPNPTWRCLPLVNFGW